MSIYVDRDRMESSTEVDLNNFVSQLLPLLHKELNKSKGGNQPIGNMLNNQFFWGYFTKFAHGALLFLLLN